MSLAAVSAIDGVIDGVDTVSAMRCSNISMSINVGRGLRCFARTPSLDPCPGRRNRKSVNGMNGMTDMRHLKNR